MNETKKISRRKLFKIFASVLTVPFAALWFSELKTHLSFAKKSSKIEIPANINEGITFIDKIIVEKKGDTIRVFSSRCTHLGCKINSEIDGKFVCPCHGSKFDLNGTVVNGPAVKNLNRLEYTIDKKTGKMVVYV